MEYYSAIKRNEIELFVVRWMELESVIQSEVNQKEKNKYHILMHICGIQKNGTDKPVCKAEIDTDVENKHTDTKGGQKGGGGGINWEFGIDLCTLICIKQITNKNLLYKNK